ncbi:MAG: hypothetical protein ACREEN_01545 [Stellaceae bacterium]
MTLDGWFISEEKAGRKITNAAFARKIGVKRVSVGRYRRGRIPESPEIMAAIGKATGRQVTANDFYRATRKKSRLTRRAGRGGARPCR